MQYLKWAGLDPTTDADKFWTSPRVKQLYMNHVRTLFNRRNVYTGLLYKVGDINSLVQPQLAQHSFDSTFHTCLGIGECMIA